MRSADDASFSLVARCAKLWSRVPHLHPVAGVAERQRASRCSSRRAAACGRRPHLLAHTSGLRREANSAWKSIVGRAVQQAAAPDRGPFVGPALKRFVLSRLRPLRSWHTGARGRVSAWAFGGPTVSREREAGGRRCAHASGNVEAAAEPPHAKARLRVSRSARMFLLKLFARASDA